MFVKTEFVASEYSVTVSHEPTTGDPIRLKNGVTVSEADVAGDTLTTVGIRHPDKLRNVYLLWNQQQWHQWDQKVSVLYVPETSILFLGVGYVAAAVDTQSLRIVQQHKPDLFWGFQHAPNSVLELGELECRLYCRNGELLGSVPVDPPYDVEFRDKYVEFVTTLFGTQRLQFPL